MKKIQGCMLISAAVVGCVLVSGCETSDYTDNVSDIDMYVEFSKPLGLRYCSFVSDIEESLGKCVDIITKDALYNPATLQNNQQLIQRISEERKSIYAKTDK